MNTNPAPAEMVRVVAEKLMGTGDTLYDFDPMNRDDDAMRLLYKLADFIPNITPESCRLAILRCAYEVAKEMKDA